MEKAIRTSSIHTKFILSYLIFLVFSTLVFTGSYLYLTRTVKKIEIAHARTVLEKTMTRMESRFRELKNIVKQISLDPGVLTLISSNYNRQNSPELYKVINLQERFPRYELTNDFVENIFLIFDKYELILGLNSGALRIEDFYGLHLNYAGMPFEQWWKEITAIETNEQIWSIRSIVRSGRAENYLTYIGSLFTTGKSVKGHVLIIVKEESVLDFFSTYQLERDYTMQIIDDSGQTIAYGGFSGPPSEPIFPGTYEDYLENNGRGFLSLRSSELNWTVQVGLPLSSSLKELYRVRSAFLLILFLELIIGVVLSFFLSAMNSRPFTVLEKDKHKLEVLLDKQKSVIRISSIERLFSGTFSFSDSFSHQIIRNEIDVSAKRLWVLVFEGTKIDENDSMSESEMEIVSATFLNEISNYFESTALVHPLGARTIGVIYRDQAVEEDENIIMKKADELIRHLESRMHLRIRCGLGSSCSNLFEISIPLKEARSCIAYKGSNPDTRVSFYNTLSDSREDYFYPLIKERKLLNAVLSGNTAEADKVWEEIFEQNFIVRNLSLEENAKFILELKGTLLRMQNNLKGMTRDRISGKIQLVIDSPDSFVLKKRIDGLLADLCTFYDERKHSHNNRMTEEIKRYVKENFNDHDLTLTTAAEHFNISEKYLTTFFKEQTGETFYKYLLEYRMNMAHTYLQSGMAVSSCADAVGYENPKSFSRAFKSIYNTSPREIRKKS